MPLSDDQKAMLRLLAQREQDYEDIGALMGLSVEEVRAKVREALDQLDEPSMGAPKDAPPERTLAPKVEEPPPPPEEAEPETPPAQTPPVAKPSASPFPRVSLPSDRRLLAGAAGGAAVVIALIVLLAAGAFSGGGSSTPASSTGGTTTANATAAAGSKQLTQAVLAPVNGGDAQGRALFGRVRNTPVLEVVAQGLTPSPKGQSYTVWLYHSPKLVLRIGAVRVPKSGGIAAQFPIPTQVLAYVAGGAFGQVDVSLTPDAAYKAEVARAKKQKRLPRYTGTDVLRGRITGPAVKK